MRDENLDVEWDFFNWWVTRRGRGCGIALIGATFRNTCPDSGRRRVLQREPRVLFGGS